MTTETNNGIVSEELGKRIRRLRTKALKTTTRFGIFRKANNRLRCYLASTHLPEPKPDDPMFHLLLENGTTIKVKVLEIYEVGAVQ